MCSVCAGFVRIINESGSGKRLRSSALRKVDRGRDFRPPFSHVAESQHVNAKKKRRKELRLMWALSAFLFLSSSVTGKLLSRISGENCSFVCGAYVARYISITLYIYFSLIVFLNFPHRTPKYPSAL